VDGSLQDARFKDILGIALDSSGNVYVCDSGNFCIRKINVGMGQVGTLAGDPPTGFGFADGTAGNAKFQQPTGIAVDANGNVFVSDSGGAFTIRKITQGGVVTTIAGSPGVTGTADGTGSAALFNALNGLALDAAGNIFVTDDSNTIRKITSAGVVTTLAGTPRVTGTTDGTGAQALFNGPEGIAVDGNGDLFVADTFSDTIRARVGSAPVPPGSGTARLVNISTRAQVGTGGNILIPGLAITGGGAETLLIRADGPGLTQFSVPGVLAQPILSVFNSAGTVIASNTGWGTSSNPALIASTAASVGAFALAAGSADSALIVDLPAGTYTIQISGVGGTTGVALAEVYEVASSGTRLVNISTRTQVGTGGNIIISGFAIAGTGTAQLLVRGDGPSLTQFSVPGILAQPSLTLVNQTTGASITSNTGWGNNADLVQVASAAASVGAFAFTPGSADSAVLVDLAPGSYSAEVSGVSGGTGVALVEVYEVP
jgi:sugar lactone lactonase YvrE